MQSLAFFALLTCVVVAGEQTNKVRSIVLPAENWDVKEHVLASLVTTNAPGTYTLPTAWSGEERITTCTGWFKWCLKTFPEIYPKTNEWFVAAKFQVLEDSKVSRRLGNRILWLGGKGMAQASYRPSLPSDADLLAMTNSASVSNLFGWNPFSNPTNTESGRMRFFTLRPYDTIELLQVGFKLREDKLDIVDSVLVRRGKLHPQQRQQ
jgi:hypothetical protein